MVLVQKWPFWEFFFLGNIGEENVFYDVLERKNTFLDNKNMKSKKSKNWHFPKGLTHGFGLKIAIFPTLFLGNIGGENVFCDIPEQKKHLSRLKKHELQKIEQLTFFQRG